MKTFIFIVLIGLILMHPTDAQVVGEASRSDREVDGLKGPVRRVRIDTRTLINETIDGKKISHWVEERTTTRYDINGNELESQWLQGRPDPSGRVSFYSKYKEHLHYDNDGRKSELLFFINAAYVQGKDEKQEDHDQHIYTCDDKGRVIQEDFRDIATGAVFLKELSTYNSSGLIAEQETYSADGRLQCTVLFSYDANSRLLTQIQYDRDGSLYFKQEYTYDDKGNLIRADSFDNQGAIITSDIYDSYEVDSRENWTKRRKCSSTWYAASTVSVSYRKIAYY